MLIIQQGDGPYQKPAVFLIVAQEADFRLKGYLLLDSLFPTGTYLPDIFGMKNMPPITFDVICSGPKPV
ncbi:MAG: hypothetical protein HC880_21205 [Bacteroidia bacterium]|nr:hypothetical protein [Bacteroidia bacterium]